MTPEQRTEIVNALMAAVGGLRINGDLAYNPDIQRQQIGKFVDLLAVAVETPTEIIAETPEQIDALPFLSIIREVFKPSPGRGLDYGGVYERRTSGWHPIAGTYRDPAENGQPNLPCRVLYNPER
jgi:hypothetical protein